MDDHGFPHVLTSTCAPWLAAALDDPYHDAAKARVDECMTSDRDDHDDVVDESDLRRGQDSANAVWGNKPSVLVGDFLFSRAFQLMVGDGDIAVLKILSDASAIISEGEVLQLLNIGNTDIDEAAYLRVIQYKTANY